MLERKKCKRGYRVSEVNGIECSSNQAAAGLMHSLGRAYAQFSGGGVYYFYAVAALITSLIRGKLGTRQ
jgi:hypothetical protein